VARPGAGIADVFIGGSGRVSRADGKEQVEVTCPVEKNLRSMHAVTSGLGLVVAALVALSSPIVAQRAAPILDRVARSLPESNQSWRLIEKNSQIRDDGSAQASFRWTDGGTNVGATVIIHRKLFSAKKAFEPNDKNDAHEGFLITGIGDKAYLWPPKVENGGYNLRFRKGRVEVWMSGASEDVLKRCAQHVAASIAHQGNRGSGLKY
jgi:hypothetical protein